jgi:hypothetical protein
LFYLDKFLSFQNSKKLHMVENQIWKTQKIKHVIG